MFATPLIKTVIRFRRNIRHNRFFVLFGGRIYWRVPRFLVVGVPTLARETIAAKSDPARVFRRVDLRAIVAPVSRRTTAVSIPHLGRFGNAALVLVPALARAFDAKFGALILHGDSVISAREEFDRRGVFHTGSDLNLWFGVEPQKSQNTIVALVTPGSLTQSISQSAGELAWAEIFNVLFNDHEEKATAEDSLVIHLRGGDVYGTRLLPNHGQPPLSYYTKILKSAQWSSVHVVFQAPYVPVLDGIRQHCADHRLPYSQQCASIREDMAALLRATNLVVGRSTFAPAIVGLSPAVKRVFCFESGFRVFPPKSNLTLVTTTDRLGVYREKIMSNNWRNTKEQVQMMLDYPEDALEIEKWER